MKEQTQLLHPEYTPPAGFAAIAHPVHRASTVLFPNVAALRNSSWKRKDGYTYGLRGTPTTYMLEALLAQSEGGTHTLLVPSGLAAISLANLSFLNAGDEVLIPENVYSPSKEQAEVILTRMGISHRFYNPMQPEALSFHANTKLMWIEAPGSVTMEVPDVPALVKAAKAQGVITAFDNTWAAGLSFKPFAHGIDVSIQALTKFQAGGADLLMGSVTFHDEKWADQLMFTHMRLGFGVSAEDAALVLRSLPTMRLRYDASDVAGRAVAQWCAAQPQVARVLHPAFESCPGHANFKRDFTGAAGLFSIVLDERFSQAQLDAFVDHLKLFKIGYSWAGPVSLAVPYDIKMMRPLTAAQWQGGGLVRLWIGLEDTQDLIADLQQAMQKAFH